MKDWEHISENDTILDRNILNNETFEFKQGRVAWWFKCSSEKNQFKLEFKLETIEIKKQQMFYYLIQELSGKLYCWCHEFNMFKEGGK